jgi:hypothetical protein
MDVACDNCKVRVAAVVSVGADPPTWDFHAVGVCCLCLKKAIALTWGLGGEGRSRAFSQ